MSNVPSRFFVAFGVVLGAFCASRHGDAQQPKGTSSVPSKASAARRRQPRTKRRPTSDQRQAFSAVAHRAAEWTHRRLRQASRS